MLLIEALHDPAYIHKPSRNSGSIRHNVYIYVYTYLHIHM